MVLDYTGDKMMRKVACGGSMALSLALAVWVYRTTRHHDGSRVTVTQGDLVFYPVFAFAVATFMTAWILGWMLDSVLGDKRRSLSFIFLLFFGGLVLMGLGPVLAASVLGKSTDWVNDWRTFPVMAVLGWQTLRAVRETRSKAS